MEQGWPKPEKIDIGDKENKVEKSSTKKELDSIFKEHPELAQFGTKEQYSEYIDTIFPDSKIKDIVYHGSEHTFSEFRNPSHPEFQKNKRIGTGTKEYGIYFTKYKHFAKYAGKNTNLYSVVVNAQNPYVFEGTNSLAFTNFIRRTFGNYLSKKIFGYTANPLQIQHISITKEQHDRLTEHSHDSINMGDKEELIVFEPEQIHILGTESDIEKFKEFIDKKKMVPDPHSSV